MIQEKFIKNPWLWIITAMSIPVVLSFIYTLFLAIYNKVNKIQGESIWSEFVIVLFIITATLLYYLYMSRITGNVQELYSVFFFGKFVKVVKGMGIEFLPAGLFHIRKTPLDFFNVYIPGEREEIDSESKGPLANGKSVKALHFATASKDQTKLSLSLLDKNGKKHTYLFPEVKNTNDPGLAPLKQLQFLAPIIIVKGIIDEATVEDYHKKYVDLNDAKKDIYDVISSEVGTLFAMMTTPTITCNQDECERYLRDKFNFSDIFSGIRIESVSIQQTGVAERVAKELANLSKTSIENQQQSMVAEVTAKNETLRTVNEAKNLEISTKTKVKTDAANNKVTLDLEKKQAAITRDNEVRKQKELTKVEISKNREQAKIDLNFKKQNASIENKAIKENLNIRNKSDRETKKDLGVPGWNIMVQRWLEAFKGTK